MSGIRGTNTKPELVLRKGLHARGFRFRLHDKSLPGKPDIVLPRHRAVVLAHGCFWHGHSCHLFKWPETREHFWRDKIARNREVDVRNEAMLGELGWRQAVVWECALKGRTRLPIDAILDRMVDWLKTDTGDIVIRGSDTAR